MIQRLQRFQASCDDNFLLTDIFYSDGDMRSKKKRMLLYIGEGADISQTWSYHFGRQRSVGNGFWHRPAPVYGLE